MTMTWAEVNKGDLVQLNQSYVEYSLNGRGRVEFNPSQPYEVRRVETSKVVLRHGARNASAWVPLSLLNPGTPADPNAPRPRQLGETPEGDHVAITDPRIAWIWDDAAKVADKHGYCSTYDTLAEELGAPGREKNYKVWATVNGLKARIEVKARSKKLAEALVAEKLAGSTDVGAES